VDAAGRELEDSDGPSAHAVAAPAEDHGIDSPGQDALEQHFPLFLVEQPTKDELHQARKL
jgi:hypothetical protein